MSARTLMVLQQSRGLAPPRQKQDVARFPAAGKSRASLRSGMWKRVDSAFLSCPVTPRKQQLAGFACGLI